MLRVDHLAPLVSGAVLRWRPMPPARAQARLWGILVEIQGHPSQVVTPITEVRLFGGPVLTYIMEPIDAGGSATYHVALSGQGARRVVQTTATEKFVVEILPRLPWIPPDIPCEIQVQPGHTLAQVSVARVIWEDLPWESPVPRRVTRIGDMTDTPR